MAGEFGRPSSYTEECAQEICDRLTAGEPLSQICRDDHMPSVRTVYSWKAVHEDFSTRIAHAREDGHDYIAAECLSIADETNNDTINTENGDRPNAEWIARSKLRIWTRLELLKKWDPKRYGDSQKIDINDVTPRTPEQVEARLNEIFAKAAKEAAKKQ